MSTCCYEIFNTTDFAPFRDYKFGWLDLSIVIAGLLQLVTSVYAIMIIVDHLVKGKHTFKNSKRPEIRRRGDIGNSVIENGRYQSDRPNPSHGRRTQSNLDRRSDTGATSNSQLNDEILEFDDVQFGIINSPGAHLNQTKEAKKRKHSPDKDPPKKRGPPPYTAADAQKFQFENVLSERERSLSLSNKRKLSKLTTFRTSNSFHSNAAFEADDISRHDADSGRSTNHGSSSDLSSDVTLPTVEPGKVLPHGISVDTGKPVTIDELYGVASGWVDVEDSVENLKYMRINQRNNGVDSICGYQGYDEYCIDTGEKVLHSMQLRESPNDSTMATSNPTGASRTDTAPKTTPYLADDHMPERQTFHREGVVRQPLEGETDKYPILDVRKYSLTRENSTQNEVPNYLSKSGSMSSSTETLLQRCGILTNGSISRPDNGQVSKQIDAKIKQTESRVDPTKLQAHENEPVQGKLSDSKESYRKDTIFKDRKYNFVTNGMTANDGDPTGSEAILRIRRQEDAILRDNIRCANFPKVERFGPKHRV